MSQVNLPDYKSIDIAVPPYPEGEGCGDGWWRVQWTIATDPSNPLQPIRMPIPSSYLGEMTLVVAALSREPGQIVVEALLRNPQPAWNEITYLSQVLRAIRDQYRQVTIDGYADHPLLHI